MARFSPRKPTIRPELWSPGTARRTSQSTFQALELATPAEQIRDDPESALVTLPISAAREDGVLQQLESRWDPRTESFSDSALAEGVPILTFNRLLTGDPFPFCDALNYVLDRATEGVRGPVDLEFTADFRAEGKKSRAELRLLQLRQLPRQPEGSAVDITPVPAERVLLRTSRAMGNADLVHDGPIIYIPPMTLDPIAGRELAEEVARINRSLRARDERYLLVGPGRWGSVNPAVGVPVSYHQISQARLIVELSTAEHPITVSEGTHFFNNIASGHVLYMAVDEGAGDLLNRSWFDQAPANPHLGDQRVLLIRPGWPVRVQVDGRSHKGAAFIEAG